MFTLPPALRIYLATTPTDLRKGFDGLSAAVMQIIGEDPTSGHLFVFRNRRSDQIRILFWDRTGYCSYAKRLAQGRFYLPITASPNARHAEVDAAELGLLLEGIDLSDAQRRKRFRLVQRTNKAA
jgi:transposase